MIKFFYSKFKSLFIDDFNDDSALNNHANLLKPLFGTLVAAVLAIGIIFWFDWKYGRNKESFLGPFGDFFGGMLNPVFTFLTFFGLIITIVIQRMELRLARLEYSKTGAALNTQAIENTFFNVLDLHHEIVSALSFDPDIFLTKIELEKKSQALHLTGNLKPRVNGRAVFNAILEEIRVKCANPSETYQKYLFLQISHNYVLGHYFRNLYQALKLIDSYPDEALTKSQKDKYASILRSQLSSGELALLFINCLEGMVDDGQFKNLLVRYRMFEHLPLHIEDGEYKATGSDVVLADSFSISYYLEESQIKVEERNEKRGAFGSNPIQLLMID